MKYQVTYSVGTEYSRAVGGANVRITNIKTEKNKQPLIYAEYMEPGHPEIRMHEDDLLRLLFLERWTEVKK